MSYGELISGIACDFGSRGYEVLYNATKEVIGEVNPYSITGSLPLVKDLQVPTHIPHIHSLFLCTSFCFSSFFYDTSCRRTAMMFRLLAMVRPGKFSIYNHLSIKLSSIQMVRFTYAGLTATYHANDEYCNYSDMANGYKVFASIISQLEEDY